MKLKNNNGNGEQGTGNKSPMSRMFPFPVPYSSFPLLGIRT